MQSTQIIEHASASLSYTPFEVKWIPSSARMVVVGSAPKGTGVIEVFELSTGKLQSVSKVEKKDAFKCATFEASLYEKRHLATGSFNGQLEIFDIEAMAQPVYSVKAHQTIINCIAGIGGLNVGYGAPELVTGSRDGCVKVWDPRQELPVASLEPADGETPRDCWSVAFGNSYNEHERCVVAGYDNGDLKMLDLRQNKLVWETNIKNGIVGCQFDRPDIKMNKLIVTSLESKFRMFDMRTKHPELEYSSMEVKAHKSTVWKGAHLPQNRDLFMTTGGNGSLNLYKYIYPAERSILDSNGFAQGVMGQCELLNSRRFADQPVVSFEWNADKAGLACCVSLDQQVRVVFATQLNNA